MRHFLLIALALPLLACSTTPSGPSALVLPGKDKTETQFRADDAACRSFADRALATAIHPPHSLAEGQMQFDISYLQCMYGRDHTIPIPGEMLPAKASDAPFGPAPYPTMPFEDKP